MKLSFLRRESTLYIRKRVPRRYREVEAREFIWISLHTDSETQARIKAPTIWQEMIEAWEAKMVGASADADAAFAAAKNLAARRGFRYLPAAEVAKLPTEEILRRVEAVAARSREGRPDRLEAAALLGLAKEPKFTVSKALRAYWSIAEDKTLGKSADQIRRWENPRKKAVAGFITAVDDKPLADITTEDLGTFKTSLSARVRAGEIVASSANKDLIHLLTVIEDVARAKNIMLGFNRAKLMFKQEDADHRPPFTEKWIREKLLAPGALDGLNPEARAILLGMVNTGYRPSEGSQLTAAQIRLDGPVPYISIEPVIRALKTKHSKRIIPLVGVSLEAFKAFPNGFPRYADSPTLSATINKYLRENGLLETLDHSLYSLRHSFEDRMLAANVDERIRRDLMGHALQRMRYGDGAAMEHLQSVVASIAL
ncbi:Integrase, catalytic domain containing protein [Paracoccaceae bacterium]